MDANSEKVKPEAAAYVELALDNKEVILSRVAIMKMGNVKLLIGNDTVERSKGLKVNYQPQEGNDAQGINRISWAKTKDEAGDQENHQRASSGPAEVTDRFSEVQRETDRRNHRHGVSDVDHLTGAGKKMQGDADSMGMAGPNGRQQQDNETGSGGVSGTHPGEWRRNSGNNGGHEDGKY